MTGAPRLLILFTGAALVIVGAIVALVTESWWLLGVVFVVFLAGLAVVLVPIGRALDEGYKPDPVTEARVDAEDGVEAEDQRPDDSGGSARSRAT